MSDFRKENIMILRLPDEFERAGFISTSKAKKVEKVTVDYRSLAS